MTLREDLRKGFTEKLEKRTDEVIQTQRVDQFKEKLIEDIINMVLSKFENRIDSRIKKLNEDIKELGDNPKYISIISNLVAKLYELHKVKEMLK